MDDTLSVGDTICLYSAESFGFIFSTQSSSVHNEVAVGSRQDRQRPNIQDQQVISFHLEVANRYKLNKKLRKIQAKLGDDPENISMRNAVSRAKAAADAENDDNILEQKRQLGKKVLYGQVIQLRHQFTNKYIHVSTTKTSDTESNNMAVELKEENSKHALFRLMPRYKVKAEGDVVQVDDQVVLESMKSPGSFLHVSKPLLGHGSVYSKSHELNVSVQQSGFTINRKYKPVAGDQTKLQFGDIIRFYHKEMEAYLVAEGLFDDEICEDVHMRLRPINQSIPKTMSPSTSAITYWQIERQEGPVSGGVLKWEQQCKIIHMCTRKYMTVKDGQVTLTSDHLDPATVFRLHPVIRESDDIPPDSYCRMEHVVTGQWLHGGSETYKKKQLDGDDNIQSMAALKWTTAEFRVIETIEEMQYDDAFTIQKVDEELVRIFNHMAGMVPFVQKLIADKKEGHALNAKMAHDAESALQELSSFMVVNGHPIKNRQKLLRNLRIVELLIKLLQIPFRGTPDQFHMTKLFVETYHVMYVYLMGDSRKNELYIAKYIDFFQSQFELREGQIGLNSVHMVMELIRDNRKIVDRISHEHIDNFVGLLQRDKNHRYLDLLEVLCVCDGVSIADNQRYITEVWLMKGGRNCVYYTDLGQKIGKEKDVVYVSTTQGRTWTELAQFALGNTSEAYLFLEHQLELFRYLCHGQNDFSINVITQELNYLTWEEAFTCLSDERLPDKLRSQYCDLIITMFVDIGDNHSVVDRVKLCYIYDDIDSAENSRLDNNRETVDNSLSKTNKYFPILCEWISHFLASNGDMTASTIGNNLLVKQVLRLVDHLVSFGFYYKPEDIKKLLEPLMSLIDGRNDKPYPNVTGKDADDILKAFRTKERFERSEETSAIVQAKVQALDTLDLFFNYIFNLRMEKFMSMFKVTHTQANHPNSSAPELGPLLSENFDLHSQQSVCKSALRKLRDIFEHTSFFKNYDVLDILQDLSFYHYDEMIRMSMHLLNRYFSAYHQLFRNTVQAQVVITDKSVALVESLETILPNLRRLSSAKLDKQQTEDLVSMLDKLILMCHLEHEPEEAHAMNQSILYNHGVVEDMFTILQQEVDVRLLDQYTGQRSVLQRAFTLLRLMARDNKLVQGRLFDRFDMLLSKSGAEQELAECLTEVFTGNSNTCMKITSHQVHKIMNLVTVHKEAVPQLLDLLNAIVKVEELDLPLKRNQSFVMQYFMQYRADIAHVIDQDENARVKILVNSGSTSLQYLISMVDMLATCAEGENRHIESICQTIFSIPELLKILTNEQICDNFKLPFLRFFLWVYLNTAGGMIESGAGDMPHEKLIWVYISEIMGTLASVTKYAEDQPEITKMLLKSSPPKSDIRGDKKEEMKGTLHYVFDGVMPFLQIFCRSFYQPDSSAFPEEPEQMDKLANSFKGFLEVVAPLISIERQMKNLVACMTSLLSASTLPVDIMEEFHEKYGGAVGAHDIRSDARKEYESYYEMEEEINRQLNVFSVNMRVAYGGPNTVEAQIDYNSNAVYSEVGGDEELPLGPEFQDHLRCFMDTSKKDPVDRYRMSEKLIRQLEISHKLTHLSEKEKLEQVELDVKCLKLLRALIYNEAVKLPADWETETYTHRKKLKAISDVQDTLNHFDVIASVIEHLNCPQDDVVRETLAFLCMLLYNGNENVQSKMFEYFTGTREESFFFTLKIRMQMSAIATRERRLLHAMYQSKVEEAVQQAKALQKAMASGKMAQTEILKANRLGSMLSMAKTSMTNLRPASNMLSPRPASRFGAKSKLGGPMSRENTLLFTRGNTLMENNFLQPPTLAVNGLKKSTTHLNGSLNGFGNQKTKVAPMDDTPQIQIEKVEEEELKELLGAAMTMTGDFTFKDDGYIELVLRMLGLMCDNQHSDIQNYIRDQFDNIKSVNLVAETTKFLNILYSNINEQTMPLVVQLFDTLVEFTSGNQKNQSVVFENKVCDYINHVLRIGQYGNCGINEEYILKKSIAVLIRSLTEENTEEDEDEVVSKSLFINYHEREMSSMSWEIMEYLDEDLCVSTMTEAFSKAMEMLKAPSKTKRDEEFVELHELIETTGFAYFHIVCRKFDMNPSLEQETLVKTDIQKTAFEYYKTNSYSIEILKDDVLQKVYFRVKDKNVLREEIKDKFKYEVDRTTPSNKIRDFMDWASDIIQDIKYQRKIRSNIVGRMLLKLWLPMNYAALFLSFVICSVIMVTWRDPKNADGTSNTGSVIPEFDFDSTSYYLFLYIVGGTHNFLSLCILVTFLISNQPTFPLYTWIKQKISSEKDDQDDDSHRSWHEKKKDQSHLEFEIYNVYTIYYFLFFACSVLGTVYYGYFFCFHLLHLAELNQLLKRVRQAVTTNGKSLLMVALLGLAIFFCYSLVAFAVLRERYFLESAGRHCRTVYQCFVTMIHHGFVDTPYTTFEGMMNNNYTDVIELTIIDVTFFILITTIGLNIIFGIIVDTFSQLRDAKWEIDKDMMNNCFICSRESYDFERHGGGFENHVKTEHYQWAYLFFFIHLTETRPNDFSALELYVYNLLDRNIYDFFPLNRALSLQNEEDSNERKVEILRVQVDYMVNKMREEEAEKERQKEKDRQLAWEAEHKKFTKRVAKSAKRR
ncbi:inositol 1,4,5-trisphosphate receptor type 3-like isoform X2 [Crassostrea angulata]|uniref:inositol 1,4,5-trisphosphate receptor type 3-like isoform X2 n=1 Tax=Magallana angulata TaxID=2784310 RepID=UPI0022B2156D|nr:inositol 1,4,5-trisphosphate receptor type 3-like isoform X2 [Crassostrea angulata]